MGVHLLCCAHGNEHIRTHDVIRDTFVAIAWNVSFHMEQKQLYALHLTTIDSFHWQIDIMFTKNGIRTLTNIVIVDPTHVDLFLWSCTAQRFVASNVIEAKKKNYCDCHPINQFFLLAIEVFECLHK
jgi:hypothetical protein